MFDNLKDKLGSFRKEAEEAAEENVEEVDEEELDDEALEDADPDAASVESTDAEAADTTPDTADDETTDPTPQASTAVEPDAAVESEPQATTESATAAAAESAGQEPATDADPDFLESDESEPEADETAPDEEPNADEDEEDDATDDGGRRGLGARARSLFSGSSDESESDEATPDAESAEAATAEPGSAAGEEPVAEEEPSVDDEPAAEDASVEADEPTVEAETATDEAAVEDEDEAAEADDSTGFGTKAKSLVKGKFVIEEEDLEGPLHELEMALLSSDVEMGVAEEILDNIRDELVGETRTFTTSTGEVVEEALHDAIYDVISVGQFDFDERIAVEDKPVTIIFTGVNGVGKTTSIAKLSRYFEERGYSTVMANGDTYRAGANEQIQEHADALDTKCISHEQGGDPAAVLYDAVEYAEANDVDVVLGDTAGRLHTNEGLMDQLEKIGRVVDPDMTLFVDEAVAGQDAVNRAREFNAAAEIDGAILTKADADSNGGAAISIAHVTGKPILFLGVGQGYDDLERFDPDEMVDRLLADE